MCLLKNVITVKDEQGRVLIIIPQIIFSNRRNIDWQQVEKFLMKYIGEIIKVAETSDVIHIGKDFVDEYTGSVYTRRLKGGLAKTKANLSQAIPQVVKNAYGKRWSKNNKEKHKNDAAKGWYRYETRFAMPVVNNEGEIEKFNVYVATLVIRHAKDDKKYLYDILDIKKETSNPL